jgi:hypothetical protein
MTAFKFILIYEDRAAGLRAKEMSDRVAAQLEPGCEVSNEAWNFALLADPHLADLAASEAQEADMVIISAHDLTALPGQVRGWLETWLPERKGAQAAFVVLLGDEQPEDVPEFLVVRDDLQHLPAGPANIINLPGLSPLASRASV